MRDFLKYMWELVQVLGLALLVITAILMVVSIWKNWGLV